jgi:hypothetical protein
VAEVAEVGFQELGEERRPFRRPGEHELVFQLSLASKLALLMHDFADLLGLLPRDHAGDDGVLLGDLSPCQHELDI